MLGRHANEDIWYSDFKKFVDGWSLEEDDYLGDNILEALDACDWVIAGPKGAAAVLGIKRSTLQARVEKLGIRRARTAE